MYNVNCRSVIENQMTDFLQLSTLVENIRESLTTWRKDDGRVRIQSFEISPQLIIPLQNLHELFTTLFKETETALNEEQRRYLTTCERAIVIFYCYIHDFVELHGKKSQSDIGTNTREQARKLAYEFYHNALYELRTPYFILKGYSQAQMLEGDSDEARMARSRIYSPPIVPKRQQNIDKISYWIDELGKFIDDLSSLRKANEEEDAA